MNLRSLIARLEEVHDHGLIVPRGIGAPMSYRGSYECCAFEPVSNVTVAEMLGHARSAIDETFEGYKGGEYTFDGWTECYIAPYGSTGEELGYVLLEMILEEAERLDGTEADIPWGEGHWPWGER